jgi:hypothetical protein
MLLLDLPNVPCYDFCRSEKEPDGWDCFRLTIERRNKHAERPKLVLHPPQADFAE